MLQEQQALKEILVLQEQQVHKVQLEQLVQLEPKVHKVQQAQQALLAQAEQIVGT